MVIDGRSFMGKSALCIGINDYPGTDSDLAGCVNDAHDWSALLTARGFSVQPMFDAQATKAAMVEAIGGLVITSYSIHYTKLYEHRTRIVRARPRSAGPTALSPRLTGRCGISPAAGALRRNNFV